MTHSKKINHKYRKEMILGIVVNEYIKTVSPVSSGCIVKGYFLDLSSATIRNILAELEIDGFLAHPHTSAGRIPTQEGYRYYVDNLMSEIKLLEEEKARIKEQYEEEKRDLDVILEKTSEVISDMTQYTSIISIDGRSNKIFCKGTRYIVEYSQQYDLDRIGYILRALEEKERILELLNREIKHKINVYIGHEMACSEMEECSLAVSSYRTRQGESGRIAILGPTRMNYSRVVSALDYFSDLVSEIL